MQQGVALAVLLFKKKSLAARFLVLFVLFVPELSISGTCSILEDSGRTVFYNSIFVKQIMVLSMLFCPAVTKIPNEPETAVKFNWNAEQFS